MMQKFTFLLFIFALAIHLPGFCDEKPPRPKLAGDNGPSAGTTWKKAKISRADTLITIKGLIKDSKDEPLIGVSILVEGSTNGTTTDVDGRFSMDRVSRNAVLKISYIGYLPEAVSVNNRTNFEIILLEDQKVLEELVVVGFGSQKKESVVGSIVQMSEEVIKRNGNVTDLREALSGQLPGLNVLTSSGEPGGITTGESATNIFIRGQSTWNG